MTLESVDRALEEVRPFLIADGGNVEVVDVSNGIVSLRLQVRPRSHIRFNGCCIEGFQ